MRGLANKLGLRYCDTIHDRGYKEDVGEITRVGILTQQEPEAVSDLMYGRYEGCNIEVFNFDLPAFPDQPQRPERSCVLLTFAASFPTVSLRPHTPMSRLRLGANRSWLDFAPDEFRQEFQVDAADNETARSILSDHVIQWLLAGRRDSWTLLSRGALLSHVARLDDETWPAFVDFVIGFHQQIPEDAWITYNLFGAR
jgi:hypothetical protein